MVEKYINRDLIKKIKGKDIYADFGNGNYFPIQLGGWGYCNDKKDSIYMLILIHETMPSRKKILWNNCCPICWFHDILKRVKGLKIKFFTRNFQYFDFYTWVSHEKIEDIICQLDTEEIIINL